MSELVKSNKVVESFHITGQTGYSLVMTGIVTVPSPLPPSSACVSTQIGKSIPPPIYGEGAPARCLTYSKNGGPKIQMFTYAVYGAEDRPENMSFLNNQDNTGIAFLDYTGEWTNPEIAVLDYMREWTNQEVGGEGDYFPDDPSRVGIAGFSPTWLEYIRGGVFYYRKAEYYVSDSTDIGRLTNFVETDPVTTLLPGKTTLTFYPTEGWPAEDDEFYTMDGSDTSESLTVVSCASVPIPKAVGAEEDSDELLFTTTAGVLYPTEIPMMVQLSPEATIWELVDRDTGEVLANSEGHLAEGITVTTTTAISIVLGRVGGNRINRYSLRGVIDFVVFRYNSDIQQDSPITGLLQVEAFSKNIARVNFDPGVLDIIVPEYLPKNMVNLASMFARAKRFNQDISMWDISDVRDLSSFIYYGDFNQDISGWNTAKVEKMRYLFAWCPYFNQPIGSWNLASINDVSNMLEGALAFNQDLSNWRADGQAVYDERFGENTPNWTLPRPGW